ncbi:hypothetical protein J6590_022736 [Homalodisca vitripennis]|nr:hypothetical protein J6590_022736 [Homalodisca vitripennis]
MNELAIDVTSRWRSRTNQSSLVGVSPHCHTFWPSTISRLGGCLSVCLPAGGETEVTDRSHFHRLTAKTSGLGADNGSSDRGRARTARYSASVKTGIEDCLQLL